MSAACPLPPALCRLSLTLLSIRPMRWTLAGFMIILLLIDDDEMSRDLIKTRLDRLGYVVITAGNGREGVETARTVSPDVILMDLCMPGMDGFEATKLIKSDPATAHIPIVALTALNTNTDVGHAVRVGFDSYATKPVDLNSLYSKITDLVRRA